MDKKDVKVIRTQDVPAVIPQGISPIPEGFRVRRLVTRSRTGSEKLMLGVTHIDPSCKGYNWSFKDKDEVYYILRGRITLRYEGKRVDAQEGDAVYLPSGLEYHLDNAGTESATLVYVLTPPLE